MFERMTQTRTVVWQALHFTGLEHLTLTPEAVGLQARSAIVGLDDGQGYRLDYRVSCDAGMRVREARLAIDGGVSLHLLSDGQGAWTDAAGQPLPALAGCIDIDISATPFTNTLPIRRVAWRAGQSEAFRMAFITVPSLALSVEPQRYTCLRQGGDGALFRFESLDGGFTADLPVDADGLVLDYPGLFRRLWPR